MPRITNSNLYQPPTPGFYIYKSKTRFGKYNAQRRYEGGFVKTWTFYNVEDCYQKLNETANLQKEDLEKQIHSWKTTPPASSESP